MTEQSVTSSEKPESEDVVELCTYWNLQLNRAHKDSERWEKDAKATVKRYRNENSYVQDWEGQSAARFNVLWSNVQVLEPALYSRTPKPEVDRRHKDSDKLARLAGECWQRAVEYALSEYRFDEEIRAGILDYLLPGRGVVRVAYEPEFSREFVQTPVQAMGGKLFDMAGNPVKASPRDVMATPNGFFIQQEVQQVTNERAVCKYVHWDDFRHSPARTWASVWWVAFRSHLDKEEAKERFGKEVASAIPYSAQKKMASEQDGESKDAKCAEVWEVWDKRKKQVVYLVKGYDKAIEVKDDPLKLKGFFPLGRPLFANLSTDSLKPKPDFMMYKDQADQLDNLTMRIGLLTEALRVVGVYDSSVETLDRLLGESTENQMIPVDAWAMFAEKGGLKGVVDFFPLDTVANVLQSLYEARDRTLQSIYEVTGISDIIRGASDPSDTATAQQIKGQFATLRIASRQQAVQEWARDAISLMAEIIAEHFDPERVRMMCGYDSMPGANPQDPQEWEGVVKILKDDPLRRYRLTIETDSTLAVNDQVEKQRVNEYVEAVGKYLANVLPMIQNAPELGQYMGETLKFISRRYRAGRSLEEMLDNAITQLIQRVTNPPPPQPDPRAEIEGQKMDLERNKLQLDAQQMQAEMQLAFQKLAKESEITTQKLELEVEKIRADMQMRLAEIVSTQQVQAAKAMHEKEMKAEKEADDEEENAYNGNNGTL